jgi:pimeloyl-ACP methyl ester carboxylesterase
LSDLATLAFAAPFLAAAPRGDGHAVLVIPGFMADDRSTAVLRAYLDFLGYASHPWGLGRNLGPRVTGRNGDKLVEALRTVHDAAGRKVSVIGWSLGGVMARHLARQAPDMVRQVVTLGSPFRGNPKASTVWKAYGLISGQHVDDGDSRRQMRESAKRPSVPSTAIYSREDGIVAWRNCREPTSRETDNIEVHGSHCGLGVNASVLYAIADRLAQAEGDWNRFDPSWPVSWHYPEVGRG